MATPEGVTFTDPDGSTFTVIRPADLADRADILQRLALTLCFRTEAPAESSAA